MNALNESRTKLYDLLSQLTTTPKLLLCEDVVFCFDELVTTYQRAYHDVIDTFTRDTDESTHHVQPLPHDVPDSAPQVVYDLDAPEESMTHELCIKPKELAREKSILSALTPGTLVLVNEIPELFGVFEHGLEGRHVIAQIERLKTWSLKDSYLELSVPRQHELAHYLVARLRGVQDALSHHDAQTYKQRFREVAVGIMELFKEKGQNVGFIYGLKLADGPQHGPSWGDDARHWREALLEHITPPDYDAVHPPTPSSNSGNSSSSVPSPIPVSLAPYVSALEHKRVLCVGGKRKPHQLKNLNAWFPTTVFGWVESEKGKGMRHAQRESERIKAGRYDMVWMFARALSHSETDLLIEACKQSSHRVHRVCIEKGFGPGDLLDGLDRSSPPLLNSETEEE
jgi:hypothetical protein